MPKVKFTATKDREEWTHSPGGVEENVEYGDGTTIMVREPVVLEDGDIVEMTDFQADWATTMHPENFTILGNDEDAVLDPAEDGFAVNLLSYRQMQRVAQEHFDVSAGGTEDELRERLRDAYQSSAYDEADD